MVVAMVAVGVIMDLAVRLFMDTIFDMKWADKENLQILHDEDDEDEDEEEDEDEDEVEVWRQVCDLSSIVSSAIREGTWRRRRRRRKKEENGIILELKF